MNRFESTDSCSPVVNESVTTPLLNLNLYTIRSDFFPIKGALTPSNNSRLAPRGTSAASIMRFVVGTIGVSAFSMPSVFKECGLAVALLCIFLVGFFVIQGIRYLTVAMEEMNCFSYEELCRSLIGRTSAVYVRKLFIVYQFGVLVAYVVVLRNISFPLVRAFFPAEVVKYWDPWNSPFSAAVIFVCAFIFPLLLYRWSLSNDFRQISFLGVGVLVFVCLLTIFSYFFPPSNVHPLPLGELKIFGHESFVFLCLPLLLFGYDGMQIAFQVYSEMKNRSEERMNRVAVCDIAICGIFYTIIGLAGYAVFGEGVHGNMLSNFDPKLNVVTTIAFTLCCCFVAVAYVTNLIPIRDVVLAQLSGESVGSLEEISWAAHAAVCYSTCILTVFVSYYTPSIVHVFCLLGAIGGSAMCLILPSLFVLQLHWAGIHKAESDYDIVLMFATLCLGIICAVLGSYVTTVEMLSAPFEM